MALPISKRDSLLEKDAMFRDSGGALTRQSSQDNGLDGPYPSTTNKLEQVEKINPQIPESALTFVLCSSGILYPDLSSLPWMIKTDVLHLVHLAPCLLGWNLD